MRRSDFSFGLPAGALFFEIPLDLAVDGFEPFREIKQTAPPLTAEPSGAIVSLLIK